MTADAKESPPPRGSPSLPASTPKSTTTNGALPASSSYYGFGAGASPFMDGFSGMSPHMGSIAGSPGAPYLMNPHAPNMSPFRKTPSTSRRGGKTPGSSPLVHKTPPYHSFSPSKSDGLRPPLPHHHSPYMATGPRPPHMFPPPPYGVVDPYTGYPMAPAYGHPAPMSMWPPPHPHNRTGGTTPKQSPLLLQQLPPHPSSKIGKKKELLPSAANNNNSSNSPETDQTDDNNNNIQPTDTITSSTEPATSPTQIIESRMEDVQQTGCTCKKTRCLKLYCQCFAVKLYCGDNCRCLSCHNSVEHENERQNAMRMIMVRNPTAFDTKFKKSQLLAAAAAATVASSPSRIDKVTGKLLAHKTGCKCRKSGCMKKYCECFAGNVKCSVACRCMGCKNMGPFIDHNDSATPPTAGNTDILPMPQPYYSMGPMGYHPHHPSMMMPVPPHHGPPPMGLPHASGPHPTAATTTIAPAPNTASAPMSTPTKKEKNNPGGSEPWLAAQNLTFLKRGTTPSPSDRKESKREPEDKELQSVPSLAASSSGEATSPAAQDNDADGVNSLLMAAMAMTGEFANVDKKTKLSAVTSTLRKKEIATSASGHERLVENMKRSNVDSPTIDESSKKKRMLSPAVAQS